MKQANRTFGLRNWKATLAASMLLAIVAALLMGASRAYAASLNQASEDLAAQVTEEEGEANQAGEDGQVGELAEANQAGEDGQVGELGEANQIGDQGQSGEAGEANQLDDGSGDILPPPPPGE